MSNLVKIQEVTENMIRIGGYNSFSFREVANRVGIKSSSVHYHFPTKVDLAVAVARRYTDNFMSILEEENQSSKTIKELLHYYISLFEKALKEECKMCLCGLLAAESSNLPEEITLEVQRFFNLNINWLSKMFLQLDDVENNQEDAEKKAVFLISALEGAMLTSQVNNNNEMFDMTTQQIKVLLKF